MLDEDLRIMFAILGVVIFCLVAFSIFYCVATAGKYKRRFFDEEIEKVNRKVDEKYVSFKGTSLEDGKIVVRYTNVVKKNKIERYVQSNYQRTPIYGIPEIKESSIKEIKIFNSKSALDGAQDKILDAFLDFFLDPIIEQLDYIPEWYLQRKAEVLEEEKTVNYDKYLQYLGTYKEYEGERKTLIRKIEESEKELETAGFFKKKSLNKDIKAMNQDLEIVGEKADISKIKMNEYGLKYKNLETVEKTLNEYNNGFDSENNFISLPKFLINEPEEFKGCYIIRNAKNNKVYVGQSKNVIKRINQHFDKKTFAPKNPIFMEDYYRTEENERKGLFEIQTIRLETKDELDRTEKELIGRYDSFRNGYNATAGNC